VEHCLYILTYTIQTTNGVCKLCTLSNGEEQKMNAIYVYTLLTKDDLLNVPGALSN